MGLEPRPAEADRNDMSRAGAEVAGAAATGEPRSRADDAGRAATVERAVARRSCLVVPGHVARMHVKARASDADEIVFDLEDAVPANAKSAARDQLVDTLSDGSWARRTVAVRVNAPGTAELDDDLALCADLVRPGLSIVVPKAEDPVMLQAIAAALPAGVPLQALVETPAGILAAAAIAATDPVCALILGYADLAAALGRRGAEHDAHRWLVHQEAVLAAARAAGVQAIDGPHFQLGEERGLRARALAARELGFDGKWAIHPEQVGPLNAVFSATDTELERARRIRAAAVAASAKGLGAVRVDGAMVDEAMVRHADRILALPRRPTEPAVQAVDPASRRRARVVAAPYYDDLRVGDVFHAPGLTLTPGHAVLHQAVIGDRLRLALDGPLYEAVTGRPGVLAHPMLVCDVAIGQSTAPSGRVLGNLFYRGLGCRPIALGTTLRTRTEVVARRRASRSRGLVALHVTSVDERGTPVLDFWRCPLLPAREDSGEERGDDLDQIGAPVDARALVPTDWDLAPMREAPLGELFGDLRRHAAWEIEANETVTSAPELARLTLNLAMTHTDETAGAHGRRLVYGGHVIGVAAAHVTRALPDLATIVAWRACDHTAPTFEGDLLRTRIDLERTEPLADGGLVHLHARVAATTRGGDPPRNVLDWRLVALMP